MSRIALSAALAVISVAMGFAQAPGPAFEVASIRRSAREQTISESPTSFARSLVTVQNLVQIAYDLPGFRIVGGPEWIRSVPFDVYATTSAPATVAEKAQMLQRLLAERFGLEAHFETRQLPAYSLVFSRPDKRFGPNLRLSELDCPALLQSSRNLDNAPRAEDGSPLCLAKIGSGGSDPRLRRIEIRGHPASELAQILASLTGMVVTDRTGLAGTFDVEVTFARERDLLRSDGTDLPNGVSIFAALPEQLGLKLEAREELVQVLVIDSVQRPTEN